eukprot:CAMPEP_0174715356 /NCGR_PEP_ID=MMETSP1094-20130205/21173_1 /TAXON_ID=156173 /ORGANISM="Chrysochromulina brevifilum, Strain UTEX LB 985" /LENGTH=183 /DNA_ID=CAMNT_0015914917 /DNA_START=106 /DNA_END=653 /DNA_ORIENTATION=-
MCIKCVMEGACSRAAPQTSAHEPRVSRIVTRSLLDVAHDDPAHETFGVLHKYSPWFFDAKSSTSEHSMLGSSDFSAHTNQALPFSEFSSPMSTHPSSESLSAGSAQSMLKKRCRSASWRRKPTQPKAAIPGTTKGSSGAKATAWGWPTARAGWAGDGDCRLRATGAGTNAAAARGARIKMLIA